MSIQMQAHDFTDLLTHETYQEVEFIINQNGICDFKYWDALFETLQQLGIPNKTS